MFSVLLRNTTKLLTMSMMRQKGIDLNNDFYVVVGKQYELTSALFFY